jgi:acyl transferase domain-containing protein
MIKAGRSTQLLVLSAPTPAALADIARDTAGRLTRPGARLEEVCARAAAAPHSVHRLSVTGRTAEEVAAGLEAYVRGETVREVCTGEADSAGGPPVAFLFSGQGAQFAGMALGLYRSEPVFQETFDRCAEAAAPFVSAPLHQLLDPDADARLVHRLAHAALGSFCVSVALDALWRSWGVEPAAVLGFSSGEYAAAHCAGVLGLADAVRLLGTEITLAERVTDGAMAVVTLDERAALDFLADSEPSVGIAAVISEHEVTLSGGAKALDAVAERLQDAGVRVSSLPVPAALHSPLHEPSLDELESVARTVSPRAPRIPWVSTVTGQVADAARPADAGHWRRHMRGPVRFLDALRTLDALGPRAYVEAGPGRALVGLGARCLPGDERQWLASLGRSTDGSAAMLGSLGRLYTTGADVDWSRVYPGT